MQISAELDMSRVNNAIAMVEGRAGITSVQAVEQAATFFTRSLVRSLPSSKAKRKTVQFNDARGRNTFGVFPGKSSRKLVMSRKRSNLRRFLPIAYQGLAKATAYVAGVAAGLSVSFNRRTGTHTMEKAKQLASGLFNRDTTKPTIVLTYSNDFIAGPMGRNHLTSSRTKASKQLLAWSRRLMREAANTMERG